MKTFTTIQEPTQTMSDMIFERLTKDNMEHKRFSTGIRYSKFGDSACYNVENNAKEFNTIIGGLSGTVGLNERDFIAVIPDSIEVPMDYDVMMVDTVAKKIYNRLNCINDGMTEQGCFVEDFYIDENKGVGICKVGIVTW